MLHAVARAARRLVSRFAARVVPDRRPFPAPGLRFRPRLDGLEAREVPAANFWLGAVSADATDGDN